MERGNFMEKGWTDLGTDGRVRCGGSARKRGGGAGM